MIKYKAMRYRKKNITRVEIVRETPKQVTLPRGWKRAKETDLEAYKDTWEDARAWLVSRAKRALEEKEEELRRAQYWVVEMKELPLHEPNGD